MKTLRSLLLVALTSLAGLAFPARAALAASEPVALDRQAPLISLERQVENARYDRRGAFATAYDRADQAVEAKVAELKARGLQLADAQEAELAIARTQGQQVFRDLSLTTEETWATARENAVQAMRRLRGALENLEQHAETPQA